MGCTTTLCTSHPVPGCMKEGRLTGFLTFTFIGRIFSLFSLSLLLLSSLLFSSFNFSLY